MKKTIIASSLAIALGVTGTAGSLTGGHQAHAAEQTQSTYTVQHGDTLNKIGHKFNVTVDQLKQWNGLKSDLIVVGQKLVISEQGQSTHVQTQTAPVQQTQTQTQEKSTQNYNTSSQAQNAPSNTQTTQHAEHVSTQQAPKTASTEAPKQSETSNQVQQTQQSSQIKQSGGSVKLSNGNTAGATGSSAAQEMAKRTGVSASTWEHIIARESNGNPNARNASGAAGLFQTMPFHGSTATVQDQINAATKAYKAQGLSAWGM